MLAGCLATSCYGLLWAGASSIASDSHSRMSFSMEHGAPVSQMNGTKPFCASVGLDFKLHIIFAPLLCELESWNEYEGGKGESRLGAGIQLSLLPACMNHIPTSNSSPLQTDSISLSVNQHVHSPSNYFVRHLATVIRKITDTAPREEVYHRMSLGFLHLIFCCVFHL